MRCDYWDRGVCRSCTFIEQDYPAQVAAKQQRVAQLLDSVGASPQWCEPAVSPVKGFRTKVKLVVAGTADRPTLGIVDRNYAGIDLTECPIVAAPIRRATRALRDFIVAHRLEPYDIAHRRGELKYIIITSGGQDPYADDAQLMIRFVLRSRRYVALIRAHLPQLTQIIPNAFVVTANIHPTHEATLEGPDEVVLSEAQMLPIHTGDVTLKLGPRAFVQTNTAIASKLYRQAASWLIDQAATGLGHSAQIAHVAAPERSPAWGANTRAHWPDGGVVTSEQWPAGDVAAPERSRAGNANAARPPENSTGSVPDLWDLYCGVGGFSLHAARNSSVRVTGVEVSEQACEAGRQAARELGVDASFIAADATTWAGQQPDAPHAVIVNPPRRGIGPELAGWLEESGVPNVIYSSCNPTTLASDLHAMPHLKAVRARLFDMFPHTAHCEVLVHLQRDSDVE